MKNFTAADMFKYSVIFCLVVCLFAAVFFVRTLILSGLVGIGLACIMSPVLVYLHQRFKIPRPLGVVLTITVLAALFLVGSYFFGAFIADQIRTFSMNLPEIIEKLRERVSSLKESYPQLETVFSDFSALSVGESFFVELLKGFKGGASALTGIVLALAISVYTAAKSQEYFKGWVGLFPQKYRDKVKELTLQSGRTVRAWFMAQLTDMVIVAVLTGIGLWIVGIQYWAVFAILTGVLAIIPYIGILIVIVFSVIVTGATDPDKIWGLLIVYFVTQQLEGNVILPIVMKEQVKLPAAALIFFMVIMGVWFGLLGVFVAPPVFAVLRIVYMNLSDQYEAKI